MLEELRADGVDEELLGRIDVPAGIPIGSHTGSEIALSILAKVVAVRRGAAAAPGTRSPRPDRSPRSHPDPPLAVDPICGMTVAAVASTLSLERDGEPIYFCSEGCRAKFEAQEEHAPLAG